jgi:uncharacterized protein YdaU (DUF1376 family)
VNYYKRHLGDYAKKCGHLTPLEHGVYTLIMDAYYDREQAPTEQEAIRWARARNPDETRVVSTILAEFFILTDGRYVQPRIEDELRAAKARADHNRAVGKLGGRPSRGRKTIRVSSGLQSGSKNNPNPLIHQSKNKDTPISPPEDTVQAVVDAYHATLPKCERVTVRTPKRTKRIQAADRMAADLCQQQGWPYERAEFWASYFGECLGDPWLRGDVPNPNNPRWKQNLDVLLAEDRFAGVMDRAISAMQREQAA